MIYNDTTIRMMLAGRISPFVDKHVNSHSYDVTLGSTFIYESDDENGDDCLKRVVCSEFELHPGCAVLASTAEHIRMPSDAAAYLSMKSGMARKFLTHAMAGWVFPGFEGNITLELFNVSKRLIILQPGERIAQLTFMSAMAAIGTYRSTLPGTRGTVPAPGTKVVDTDGH